METLNACIFPGQPPDQAAAEPAPDQRPAPPGPEAPDPAILEELVIEAISIDGMCGVY